MELQQQFCGLWENDAGYVLYIESLEPDYFLVSFSPAKDQEPIARPATKTRQVSGFR